MEFTVDDDDKFDLNQIEKNILVYWKQINAFEISNKLSKDRSRYTFYDGPPFATGLPHYGHILAGTIKDTVTRWAYQTGHHVERRFGWDCHGLPVEYEIDKKLNIKGPEDVAKIGIATYNNYCREIVMRYAAEWEETIERMGRWIDFRQDYKTMYPWFMESVWFVFQQLYKTGYVYRGFKVMPYSMGCCTSLSNFEASQNYKDIEDPAITVSFQLTDDSTVKLLVWTTTPWTLPSNLALCVNPHSIYVKILDKKKNEIFILMEKRLADFYKQSDTYQILDTFNGSDLKDMKYTPIFPYFAHIKTAFRVLCDDYVSEDNGTGIVHQAPYFGEDDYRVCLANDVINKDTSSIVCPIDAQCRFTDEVKDFQGQNVKHADKEIIKYLKENQRLVFQSIIKHSYPFCYRSDTPLIYRAVPSWFIRVENMIDRLLINNSKTYWIPNYVKEKRFSNWLHDACDWSISRNRYWGNPIPLWISDDGEEIICIGSIEELKQLSGVSVNDLHREFIDDITIPSRLGKGLLHRIPEVFDCWFESGSMPYAQVHYPFDENESTFMKTFPADFIAEGIDQTRGWFYTLLVISTALFDQVPFKNVIVNGIILTDDGNKMSKRKKNYSDPKEIFDQYGADALRLYLLKSPAVRGESLKFQKKDLTGIIQEVFLPCYNALRLLFQSCDQLKIEENVTFTYNHECLYTNTMDLWIVSYTQTFIDFVHQEMNAYRLDTIVSRLFEYIDTLTKWYIKFNKKRFKGETTLNDRLNSLNTFCYILSTMSKLMAPFTPFFSEYMYQILKKLMPVSVTSEEDLSVHFQMMPKSEEILINKDIEQAMAIGQNVIESGRTLRDRKPVPLRYPLPDFIIFHSDPQVLKMAELVQDFIREGVNVRKITFTQERELYNIQMCAEPNFRTLGRKAGVKRKSITQKIREMSDKDIEDILAKNESPLMIIDDVPIEFEDVHINYRVNNQTRFETIVKSRFVVLLDCTIDASSRDEGLIHEITHQVQTLRKKARLVPTDDITIYYSVEPPTSDIARVAVERHDEIEAILGRSFVLSNELAIDAIDNVVIKNILSVVDSQVKFVISRN